MFNSFLLCCVEFDKNSSAAMVIVNCGGVYGELLLVAIEHMLYLFIFGFIHSCLDDLKFLY